MKISEFITKLEKLQSELGDVEMVTQPKNSLRVKLVNPIINPVKLTQKGAVGRYDWLFSRWDNANAILLNF